MPVEIIAVTPYFDMELFLRTTQESRIPGKEMDEALSLWEEWLPLLRARHITGKKGGCLAVWLAEDVEKAVDEAWGTSPARGFRLNALAQTLCMCAVHELVPEAEDAGCAPAPAFSPELAASLNSQGLPCAENALILGRRYAVVTPYPFRGGCEICALAGSCPKKDGDSAFSVTLPGHEPGK